MSLQRVPDRLLAVNIETGETYSWQRAGVDMLSVSDVAPLSFISVGGYSPINVSPSVVPTSPSGGDLYVNSTSDILFKYDSTRTKFLSVSEDDLVFNRLQSGPIKRTIALKSGDLSTDTLGVLVPQNATIVGISISRNSTTGALDVEIRRDNSAATLVTKTVGSTVDEVIDMTLNVDVDAGAQLQAFTSNNSTNDATQLLVTLYLKLRS